MSCGELKCGELLIGNSNFVRLIGFGLLGVPINDAVVTATLKTAEGEIVSGAVNLPLSYVADSAGEYRGVIPHTVSLVENGRYELEVTATKDGVGVGFWECSKVAKKRGCV